MAQHGPNYLQPPPDIIDDAPEWEVEKIIKAHTFGRWKKKQYLVRWKGYSPAHNSWVNSEDMHAEDLISDFEKDTSTVIKATVACQEATMPFIPYFPPFLSTYAAEPRLPGSLDMEEDNKSDQGYSDEDQPMSPEAYDPDEPPTLTTANPPSRLTAYDINPHGGWGPPSDWLTGPPTPLSEITPNTEPWPYPPEQYLSPVPSGSLPFSASPSMALSRNPSPPSPNEGTDPSPPSNYLGTDLLPPSQYSQASQLPTSPAPGHLAGPSSKTLLYHRPPTIVQNPCRTLLEHIRSPVPNTTISLQPTHQHSPKFMGSQVPATISRMASKSLVGTLTYETRSESEGDAPLHPLTWQKDTRRPRPHPQPQAPPTSPSPSTPPE
jgi:hypothetical protein